MTPDSCPNWCLWSAGGFAAHVVRALPCQDQQLPLPGGMMHPGINNQCGEDCGSFTLIRGKERGRTHSEAMLSSLVHAFRQSSVKTLRRTPVCGSQRPNTTHLWSLHPPPFHLRFLFSVYFLFIIAHPAYAVFVLAPSLSFFLFPSSIVGLICHFPPMVLFHLSGLFSLRFPSFSASLIFLCISVCHRLR